MLTYADVLHMYANTHAIRPPDASLLQKIVERYQGLTAEEVLSLLALLVQTYKY